MEININIHVHFHGDPPKGAIAHLTHLLAQSEKKLTDAVNAGFVSSSPHGVSDMAKAAISPELQALTDQVTATTGAEASAVVLIGGLRQQIIDAGTDPAKLKALTDSLAASQAALAAAVAAP